MKSRIKKLLLPGFIIFIMITSAIGFVYVSPNSSDNQIDGQKFEYNGFEFIQTSQYKFLTILNDVEFYFDYNPFELELITLPQFQITQDKVYLLFDVEEKDKNMDYSMQKLLYVLSSFGIRAVPACIKEENCPDIPVKDCNSTAFYFKKTENSNISLVDNCVVIQGNDIDLSKNVDKVNLRLLGIG